MGQGEAAASPCPPFSLTKLRRKAVLKGELIFSLFILAASLFLYWVSGSFAKSTVLQGAHMGPSFWPRLILGALIVLSGIVAAGTVRRISRDKAWGEALLTFDRGKMRFFAALALCIAYLFFLPLVGFVALTPLFMILFMLLLGEKSKGWIIGVSLVMTAVVVILFTKAMYVPLPRGVGLFREFSLLFY